MNYLANPQLACNIVTDEIFKHMFNNNVPVKYEEIYARKTPNPPPTNYLCTRTCDTRDHVKYLDLSQYSFPQLTYNRPDLDVQVDTKFKIQAIKYETETRANNRALLEKIAADALLLLHESK